jgi:MFS family permease
MIVRDDPAEKGYASYALATTSGGTSSLGSLFSGLRTVLRFKNTWLLAIAPGGIVGPILAFAGLWGVPFFATHYGMSQAESAGLTSALLVAWAVGGPAMGALSDRLSRRKSPYVWGCIVLCVGWAVLLYLPGLPVWAVVSLVVVVGLASGVVVLGFAFVKESVPPSLSGTASGVCNMGYMLGPMILQPVMGWLLDRGWKGATLGGVRVYDLDAYRAAFALMIGFSVLAVILLSRTTETYGRQRVGGEP